MTTAEIYDYMRVRYDANASQGAPAYDVQDYSFHFNRSQQEFIFANYDAKGNPKGEGAESTELRSKQLVQLKDHSVISTFTSGDHPFSRFVDLPSDLWVTLKEECDITYTDDCGDTKTSRTRVKSVTEDYYNANIKNPYKQPYHEVLWRLDRERGNINNTLSNTNASRHELILFNTATPTNYRISYYRRPKDVDLSDVNDFCELDPVLHMSIADKAVEMMMQTVGRDSWQSKVTENQLVQD